MRCKHKGFFRQDLPDLRTSSIPVEVWRQGRPLPGGDTRMKLLVSEYTRRISQAPEVVSPYLGRVERASRTRKKDGNDGLRPLT